jgi:hyperosmotically inducible protein
MMRIMKESYKVKLIAATLLALALTLSSTSTVGAGSDEKVTATSTIGAEREKKMIPASTVEAEGEDKTTAASIINDRWISSRIELAYFLDGKLNTFDVDVEVKNAVVYVIGYVLNMSDRDDALSMAKNTPGVKKVVDKLIVDPDYKTKLAKGQLFDQNLNDHWVSRQVKTRLIADPKVTGTWIGVEAEDGFVTLRGTVPEMKEIKKAEEVASGVSGVTEVKNELVCCRM